MLEPGGYAKPNSRDIGKSDIKKVVFLKWSEQAMYLYITEIETRNLKLSLLEIQIVLI